jgi:hypothetical protein
MRWGWELSGFWECRKMMTVENLLFECVLKPNDSQLFSNISTHPTKLVFFENDDDDF